MALQSALLSALLFCALSALTIARCEDHGNAPVHRFQLGRFKVHVISDGELRFQDSPYNADKTAIDHAQKQLFRSIKPYRAAQNVLVIDRPWLKIPNHRVMIDVGVGDFPLFPTAGKLERNLIASGIHPDTIGSILVTHGHPDHIGGLVAENGRIVYPNSKIYMSKKEFDFWSQNSKAVAAVLVNMPPDFVGEFRFRLSQTSYLPCQGLVVNPHVHCF